MQQLISKSMSPRFKSRQSSVGSEANSLTRDNIYSSWHTHRFCTPVGRCISHIFSHKIMVQFQPIHMLNSDSLMSRMAVSAQLAKRRGRTTVGHVRGYVGEEKSRPGYNTVTGDEDWSMAFAHVSNSRAWCYSHSTYRFHHNHNEKGGWMTGNYYNKAHSTYRLVQFRLLHVSPRRGNTVTNVWLTMGIQCGGVFSVIYTRIVHISICWTW